jgi:hypothetical protein
MSDENTRVNYLDDTRPDTGTAEWAKVREIAETDPVMGGTDGVDNEQAIALMKRTKYLKKVVEEVQAAIPGTEQYDDIIKRLAAIDIVRETRRTEHLERIVAALMLELDAKNMYPDADAIFVENFDNPDQIDLTEVQVTSVVSGSNDIDVGSSDKLVIGGFYTLTDGENMELVQIKAVNNAETTHRVILEADVVNQYRAGRTKLYRSSVAIYDGKCYGGGNTKTDEWNPAATWKGSNTSQKVTSRVSFADASAFKMEGLTMENGVLTLGSEVVGIARISTGGGAGKWARVDANGDALTADFAKIYPWAGITTVTIGSNSMTKIPAFWYKRGTAPTGSVYAGKPIIWVSDRARTGFKIHPAFMYKGAEKSCFYIGSYKCGGSSSKATSQKNVSPLVSINFTTMQSACSANNTGTTGETAGWHLQNFYETSAVNMLLLIEMGTPDAQSAIGNGNVSSSAAVTNGSTNATYRGIYDWWGNVWEMVDGIRGSGTTLTIYDLQGNQNYVNTGKTPAYNGYMTEMYTESADTYDLGAVFVPSAVDGTQSNGTYGDYIWGLTSNWVAYRGAGWSDGAYAGAFALDLNCGASSALSDIGGRLAKYDI